MKRRIHFRGVCRATLPAVIWFGCGSNVTDRPSPDSDSASDFGHVDTQTTDSLQDQATDSQTDTGSEGPSPEEVAARAEELLSQMTLEEKIDYIGGDRSFYIRPIERLGIPEIKMSDGPMGCRNYGPTTAYPAGIGAASTFDVEAARRLGAAMGRDCRARGVHVLLAPGVNIQRSPLCGRNFEYFGEDPFLSGKIAAAFVRGVQGEGVIATVKHYAANNQEWDRNGISSEVDERTLREIYLSPFERAVREGGARAVMTAYNLLNGTYCSHHAWLIKNVLEGDFGFGGIVMSDWGAVHDTAGAFLGGCDLEMPRGTYMNRDTLLPGFADGTFSASDLDDKVRRILRTIIAAGFMDRPQLQEDIPADDPASAEVALDLAREGLVLLRNEGGLLPLNRFELRKIAVIGPNATPAVTGGAGSSYVTPIRAVSVLDALGAAAPDITFTYHPGVQETDDAAALEAETTVREIAADADAVIVALGFGQSAETNSRAEAFDPAWPAFWAATQYTEAEGADRPFDLPSVQVRTAKAAAAANSNTIVVMNAGAPVALTGFLEDVGALLWAWYPGGEGNKAVAEAIFGDLNPSGRLPMTIAARYEDYPSAPHYHLKDNGRTPYTEGVFVGYRGFDASGIAPLFPFGFGLSYAQFAYSDLSIASSADGGATVSFTVENVGSVEGAEAAQVYVGERDPLVPRPAAALAGFSRMSIAPGARISVTVAIEPRAFARFDVDSHTWRVDEGIFDIYVGASQTDIRLTAAVSRTGQVLP